MKEIIKKYLSQKNLIIIALSCMVAYGFYLRVYKLDEQSYWIDEGFTIMQTKAISDFGIPMHKCGNIEYKDVVLPYILSLIKSIFGENPFTLRIFSVVCGSLAIIFSFSVARALFGSAVGLLNAFFMAFSYWHIAWSRQVRAYEFFALLLLVIIYLLIQYEKKEKSLYLISAIAVSFFTILVKSFAFLIFPALVFYLLEKKRYWFVFVIISIFAIAGLFFGYLLANALSLSIVFYLPFYLVGYFWEYFGLFFSLFIIGGYIAFKNAGDKIKIHRFNIFLFISFVVFFSFFVYVNQKRYLLILTPLLYLYSSYVIFYLASLFNKRKTVLALAILVVAVSDIIFFKSLSFVPKKEYYLEYYTPQPDFKEAYAAIRERIKENDCIISAYPYMDQIYLGQSCYGLPISLTNWEVDYKREFNRECYSGSQYLYPYINGFNMPVIEKIEALRSRGDLYFILDGMSLARIDDDMEDFITEEADLVYEGGGAPDQNIYVFMLK